MMDDMPNPLDDISWPRRTNRLLLRRATGEDVDAIGAIRAIEGVSEWLTVDGHDRAVLDAHLRRGERLSATLVVEAGDTIIGDLMFKDQVAWTQAEVADQAAGTQAELGWVIHPEHTGHGYATEAVEELLRLGFEVLRLRRLVAECFADNEASWRLMERIGMRREVHTRRDSLHRSGRWLDAYGYAMLADEWRARP
jgi:RimJ/RimL family protein N-acetyltransferase